MFSNYDKRVDNKLKLFRRVKHHFHGVTVVKSILGIKNKLAMSVEGTMQTNSTGTGRVASKNPSLVQVL